MKRRVMTKTNWIMLIAGIVITYIGFALIAPITTNYDGLAAFISIATTVAGLVVVILSLAMSFEEKDVEEVK